MADSSNDFASTGEPDHFLVRRDFDVDELVASNAGLYYESATSLQLAACLFASWHRGKIVHVPEMDFEERFERAGARAYPGGLRPSQRHVLTSFAERGEDIPDVAIELPTGEGKTLIGLLIADWALDEGMRVAYLTGNKLLAEQVTDQARSLPDLITHRFEGGHYPGDQLDDYHQAQAVGVMNYWVYFNSSPQVDPADVVIFDDAHLAEQPLGGLSTVTIRRAEFRQLYQRVCQLLLNCAPDVYPTLHALRDGSAPSGSPPELVAFNDWCDVADAVADAIESSPFFERDAKYVWPIVRPNFKKCGVLIGPNAVEIRPYHPVTQLVEGYRLAKKRVYMSATIGPPGDLQRRLGTFRIDAIETPLDLCTATTGRRTFLINPGTGAPLEDEAFGFALDQVDASARDGPGRAAWLCASNSEADDVEGLLRRGQHAVFRLRQGDDQPFERWRAAAGGQLVTAGRYDGLDMPDDTCRLVIIPSVPAASSIFERFAVAYLNDASFMRHRIGQRVTQALGRANRTAHDSALYLGLDPWFAATLANSEVRSSISREVQNAVRTALELHGAGWAAVEQEARRFWAEHRKRDTQASDAAPTRRRRPGRTSSNVSIADSADDEVSAITRFWIDDYDRAATLARAAAMKLLAAGEPEHSAFWQYVCAHALYIDDRPEQALEAVERAVESAPSTAWFVRLRRTANRLSGATLASASHDALYLVWDQWIRESVRIDRQVTEARRQLEGTHDERSVGLVVLARLCGVQGDRPGGQSASDARWTWASAARGHCRPFEVKTSTNPVARKDVAQVLAQIAEEQDRNPRAEVVGCLLASTHEVLPEAEAAAKQSVVFLHLDAALALFDHMAGVFRAYAALWGAGLAEERGRARDETENRLPQDADWLVKLLKPSKGRVIRADDVIDLLTARRRARVR